MDTPQVLLEHYLKQLRLPTMVREYRKVGEQCAKEAATFDVFLLRLVESEMLDRERRATERRIKAAKFPVSKSLESYNFLDMPTLLSDEWSLSMSKRELRILSRSPRLEPTSALFYFR